MKQYTHLVFDLDGTLIDSSDGIVEAVNFSLTKMGEPTQPAEKILPFIGYPLSQMYPNFTSAPTDELYRHFAVKAAETIVPSTTILPGVESVLEQLHHEGYQMAIATTKIRRHLKGIVAKFGWESIFPVVVGGDDVKSVKPAPDAFRLAIERLEAKPQDVIAIGDTINDILAAKRVPMQSIAVVSPYGGKEDLQAAEPGFLIEQITDLPRLLESQLAKRRDVV